MKPLVRTHTLPTGRRAALRVSLPLLEVQRRGVPPDDIGQFLVAVRDEDPGAVADAESLRIGDAIVEAMGVDPRVLDDSEYHYVLAVAVAGVLPVEVTEPPELDLADDDEEDAFGFEPDDEAALQAIADADVIDPMGSPPPIAERF